MKMGSEHHAPVTLPQKMRPGTQRTGAKNLAPTEIRSHDRPARTDGATAAMNCTQGLIIAGSMAGEWR